MSWLPSTKVLLAITAALFVTVVVAVVALIATGDRQSDDQALTPINASPSSTTAHEPAVAPSPSDQPAGPVAPVAGAYAGAGGHRPAGAEPLPTYTKGGVTYAHLLTPTGGIGCDFSTQNEYTRQGQCGVKSMSGPSSPLGTERRAGSTKGKWLFQLSGNRVGEPVSSSGTTGWMNQPANDGYQVPRVQYGKQYYFEDWVFASESNGLTVWNTVTGSGVFLSNEKAERFNGPGSAG